MSKLLSFFSVKHTCTSPFPWGKSTENVLKSEFWASVPKFQRFLTENWMHFNITSNHISQAGLVPSSHHSFLPPDFSSSLLITSSCQSSSIEPLNHFSPIYLSSKCSCSMPSLSLAYSSLQRNSIYLPRPIANYREDPINFRSSLGFLFYSVQHLN